MILKKLKDVEIFTFLFELFNRFLKLFGFVGFYKEINKRFVSSISVNGYFLRKVEPIYEKHKGCRKNFVFFSVFKNKNSLWSF